MTARVLPDLNHLFVQDTDGFPGQLCEAPAADDDAGRRAGDDRRLARAAAPVMPGAHATAGHPLYVEWITLRQILLQRRKRVSQLIRPAMLD